MDEQRSSLEEWRHEAHRLELQGKDEQAAEIRSHILKERGVPWSVLRGDALAELEHKALEGREKKAGIALMEYALVYRDQRRLNALEQAGVKAVKNPAKALDLIEKKYYLPYGLKTPAKVLRDTEKYGVDFRNVFGQTPLMIASRMGNAELAEMLLDRDADTTLVDGNGLNAFQIALDRACTDERFARTRLPPIFERLAPASLDVQVDGRLVKLDRSQMEYLMLCLAMVLFYQRLGTSWAKRRMLLTAVDFEEVLADFHDSVVPQRRKRRPYISSILAKNEVNREGPYNRKLFRRVRRGSYVLNPGLALRIEGRWQRIYQVLSPERLGVELEDDTKWAQSGWSSNELYQQAIDELGAMLRGFDDEERLRQEEAAAPPAPPRPRCAGGYVPGMRWIRGWIRPVSIEGSRKRYAPRRD
ncbi:MAG: ankyrin repeat domain-containing protein [Gammaproteobacteria bacterium]|nr:ankyrin repeat domain-containing protein [Gammaproteobacteria bacterium]